MKMMTHSAYTAAIGIPTQVRGELCVVHVRNGPTAPVQALMMKMMRQLISARCVLID